MREGAAEPCRHKDQGMAPQKVEEEKEKTPARLSFCVVPVGAPTYNEMFRQTPRIDGSSPPPRHTHTHIHIQKIWHTATSDAVLCRLNYRTFSPTPYQRRAANAGFLRSDCLA